MQAAVSKRKSFQPTKKRQSKPSALKLKFRSLYCIVSLDVPSDF
jgi:hypothetical protein